MEIKHAVVLGTGAAARQLCRLAARHPMLKLDAVVSEHHAGKSITSVDPGFREATLPPLRNFADSRQLIADADILFSTIPTAEAARNLGRCTEARALVDTSAAFRLNPNDYPQWYGFSHPHPEQLRGRWRYGLPELFFAEISGCDRVAVPGCIASAAIYALAPFLRHRLVDTNTVITIKSVSGVSGAGYKASDERFSAMGARGNIRTASHMPHRHTPEIEMIAAKLCGQPLKISLSASTCEAVRGIEVTASMLIRESCAGIDFTAVAREFYRNERFVEVADVPVGTAAVNGSNMASLFLSFDQRSGILCVVCAIDNLIKGAAGQALQNANLMLKLPEDMGLPRDSFSPGT